KSRSRGATRRLTSRNTRAIVCRFLLTRGERFAVTTAGGVTMGSAIRRTGAALVVTLTLGMWTVFAQQAPGRWDTQKYARLPQPAEEYTPVQMNDKLYLIGGNAAVLTPGARATHPARVMVYDLAANTWTEKKQTPFFADHMTAATANGKIYVFGGSGAMTQEAPSATLDNAWEYDPAADTWRALAK